MKTKLATALSIVGVLGAGSAAALVNTQILDGSGSESTASAAVLPEAATIDLTVPSTTIDDSDDGDESDHTSTTTTSAPEVTTTTMLVTTTTAAPAPTAQFLTAFNVGDSGVVTVDVVNGRLILVNAEAAPNWMVTRAEEPRADHVEVTFVSSTVRVEFAADFDGTTITPSVSSAAIPAPAAAAPAPSAGNGGGQYDDDDDEYDDDEYDDDEYDHDDDDHGDDHGDDHESGDHGDDGRDDD